MSVLIDKTALKDHLDCVCGNNTPWGKAQQAYIECFKAFVDQEPDISAKEGVRIIWEGQIDTLIEQVRTESLGDWYVGRIDGKSEEVITVEKVIEILQDAKN